MKSKKEISKTKINDIIGEMSDEDRVTKVLNSIRETLYEVPGLQLAGVITYKMDDANNGKTVVMGRIGDAEGLGLMEHLQKGVKMLMLDVVKGITDEIEKRENENNDDDILN